MKLDITGIGSELQGVGRWADGRAAFVPGALPGETVEAELVRQSERFVEARLGNWRRTGFARYLYRGV